MHSWSANLLILMAFVHLFSTFFLRAYRKPRELTWITGVLLLFVMMGFGFSGYLLPWNELAFFATKVGTGIAGAVPVVGDFLVRFLRGGDDVTGATLTRFYGHPRRDPSGDHHRPARVCTCCSSSVRA